MNCDECMAQNRFRDESALALAERTIRRLWITILILIVMMAGMSVGFFWYEAQFVEIVVEEDEATSEIEAAQFGHDNFVSGGDITYAGSKD